MHNWFLVGIKYERVAEEGVIKSVSEKYLIDALTHGEAEEKIVKELEPYISGNMTVTSVKKAKISEFFFNENGDRYFKARVNFIMFDEEKGIEKKVGSTIYVQANDIHEALSGIVEGMKGSMADYQIASISETQIMDVYKYDPEPEEK